MKSFLADTAAIQYIMESIDSEYQQPHSLKIGVTLFQVCHFIRAEFLEMDIFAIIDSFLASLEVDEDFEKSETVFHETNCEEAGNILTYLLSYGLAYGERTTMSEEQINTFVERLFSTFSNHPRYFTNGNFDFQLNRFSLRGAIPLTSYTFDTGLILIDDQRISIYWEIDED